jgi:hypothetical protein
MWKLVILELRYFPRILQRGIIIYLLLFGLPSLSYYSNMHHDLKGVLDSNNLSFYIIYNLPLILRVIVSFLPFIYLTFMIHYITVTLRRCPNNSDLPLPITIRQLALTSLVFTFITYVIFLSIYLLFVVLFKWSITILPIQAQNAIVDANISSVISYASVILSITFAITALGDKYSKMLSIIYFSFIVIGATIGIFVESDKTAFYDALYISIMLDYIGTIPGAIILSLVFSSFYYLSFVRRRSYL